MHYEKTCISILWTYQIYSYSLTISVVPISIIFLVISFLSSALSPKLMVFSLSTLCKFCYKAVVQSYIRRISAEKVIKATKKKEEKAIYAYL